MILAKQRSAWMRPNGSRCARFTTLQSADSISIQARAHRKEINVSDPKLRASITLPSDFLFGELRAHHMTPPPSAPPPTLGPLSAFVGDFVGNGFNTIFRPDSTATPTKLPNSVPAPPPPHDSVLELNLTSETLLFREAWVRSRTAAPVRSQTPFSTASRICRPSTI